jgi:hypothetical protein
MGALKVHQARGDAITLASVSALALAGCGGNTIDNGKLQNTIKTDLAARGYTNLSVNCPGNVPAQQGHSFTCSVTYTANGQSGSATIPVKQANSKGTLLIDYAGTSQSGGASGNSGSSTTGSSGNSGSGNTST